MKRHTDQHYEIRPWPYRDETLTESYLRYSGVPSKYWNATVDRIQDDKPRGFTNKYLSDVTGFIAKSVGVIIIGDPGVGKTAIASLLAMEALRWKQVVVMITHRDIQDLQAFGSDPKDASGRSKMDRIRTCQLLVLDGFDEDFVSDNKFGPVQLEKLIAQRSGDLLATMVTTRIKATDFQANHGTLWSVMRGSMVGITVTGEDLRDQHSKSIDSLFISEDVKK